MSLSCWVFAQHHRACGHDSSSTVAASHRLYTDLLCCKTRDMHGLRGRNTQARAGQRILHRMPCRDIQLLRSVHLRFGSGKRGLVHLPAGRRGRGGSLMLSVCSQQLFSGKELQPATLPVQQRVFWTRRWELLPLSCWLLQGCQWLRRMPCVRTWLLQRGGSVIKL